jgi:uncharacterized membrane protein
MTNKIDKLFSQDDLKHIEEAVHNAELQTSGEIVPYAVYASDAYDEALWRGGLVFGLGALVVFVLLHHLTSAWQPFELMQIALSTLGSSLLGVMLVR